MPLIYCVEDDENIRELVGYALRSQKFDVETFGDGAAFWQGLEQARPALILLDIMLPGESGIDILQKLRQRHAVPHEFVDFIVAVVDFVGQLIVQRRQGQPGPVQGIGYVVAELGDAHGQVVQ